jgi:hypothetical protein
MTRPNVYQCELWTVKYCGGMVDRTIFTQAEPSQNGWIPDLLEVILSEPSWAKKAQKPKAQKLEMIELGPGSQAQEDWLGHMFWIILAHIGHL